MKQSHLYKQFIKLFNMSLQKNSEILQTDTHILPRKLLLWQQSIMTWKKSIMTCGAAGAGLSSERLM